MTRVKFEGEFDPESEDWSFQVEGLCGEDLKEATKRIVTAILEDCETPKEEPVELRPGGSRG